MTSDPTILTTLTTTRLGRVIWANAGFGVASAVLLLAGSAPLAAWLEVPQSLPAAVGAGVGLFAAYVASVARRELPPAKHVRVIVIADLAWVAGAALILAVPGTLPGGGKLALGLISLPVLELGLLEWLGWRKSSS